MRSLLEALEASKQRLFLERPWTVGASAYQAALHVHEPWIAEISPMQYAGLSKAAKAAYDKQRAHEWAASAAAKEQWKQAVLKAYAEGRFQRRGAEVHPDADMVVALAQRDAQAAEDAAAAKVRSQANAITRADQVKVGDRVWVVLSASYETVSKVSAKSVTVTGRFGPQRVTMSEKAPGLRWQGPRDLAGEKR